MSGDISSSLLLVREGLPSNDTTSSGNTIIEPQHPPKCMGRGSKTLVRMIYEKIVMWPTLGQSRSFPGILHSKPGGREEQYFSRVFFKSCWIKPEVACSYPPCLSAIPEPMWKSFLKWKTVSLTPRKRSQGKRWPLSTAFESWNSVIPWDQISAAFPIMWEKEKLFWVS